MDLSKYTTQEIKNMRSNLNLTEEESQIFDLLTKGKSRQQICDKVQMSMRSVDRRIERIRGKLNRL